MIEFNRVTSFIQRYPSNPANSRILDTRNISFHGSPLPRFESVSAGKISLAFLLSTRGPIESILQQIRVTKARESRCVSLFPPLNGTPIDKYSFLAHASTNNNNNNNNNNNKINERIKIILNLELHWNLNWINIIVSYKIDKILKYFYLRTKYFSKVRTYLPLPRKCSCF